MLVLVLHDHPVHEPAREQRVATVEIEGGELERVEHRERACAHRGVELARAGRVEDVERGPVAARVLERVVHVVVRRVGGVRARQLAHEPELLVMTDVREVPAERRHELRHLRSLRGFGHRREQAERAAARLLERGDDLRLRDHFRLDDHLGRHVRRHVRRWRMSGPVVEQIVGGAAGSADESFGVLLGRVDGGRVGAHPLEREERGVEAPPRGLAERGVVQRLTGGGAPALAHRRGGRGRALRRERVVEQRDGDRHGHRPPLLGQGVDHAQFEPPAWTYGREEGGDVIGEVVGGGPAERVAVDDPLLERLPGLHRDAVSVVDADHHHRRVEHVARPVGAGRGVAVVSPGRRGARRGRWPATPPRGSSGTPRADRRRRTASWRSTP